MQDGPRLNPGWGPEVTEFVNSCHILAATATVTVRVTHIISTASSTLRPTVHYKVSCCTHCMTTDIFTNLKKHYFTNVRNSLPNSVVMADSVNSFKSHLYKFRSSCVFVYDYRAQPLTSESTRN